MASLSKTDAAKLLEQVISSDEGESDGPTTARQNVANRNNVVKNWALGPEKTSIDPSANADYWQKMADLWDVTEDEARCRFCANCEYYDNTPYMQEQMKAIPNDKYDVDGGGRGYCVKFDFICHNLRVCQAWEEKPFDNSNESEGEEDAD